MHEKRSSMLATKLEARNSILAKGIYCYLALSSFKPPVSSFDTSFHNNKLASSFSVKMHHLNTNSSI